MTTDKTSWHILPAEIRIMVLEALLLDGCSLAAFATVSREWQTIIEPHTFAQIKLTWSRLHDFGSILHRNRAFVRYIWLCLELEEYDCTQCAPEDARDTAISAMDNERIVIALGDLFSTLSLWKPNRNLLLDISVHSPSDSEHSFKYLTFGPDIPSNEYSLGLCAQQPMLVQLDDHQHGWIAGGENFTPYTERIYKARTAIEKVFNEIMDEGPFVDDDQAERWWKSLPLVPVVTGVVLRQQTRRRWRPTTLAQMFARLPRLQEICYEPWREWSDFLQQMTDKSFLRLFESLASSKLRRLTLFENFNQFYNLPFGCSPIRIPKLDVSLAVAKASLELEHLSASFIVDANYFFQAWESSWKWPRLTSLTLTSQLLTPDESPIQIDGMLQRAAAVALKMPRLKSMEIWNGRKGLAMLFRYQLAGEGQPAVITWRGTWGSLRQPVVQAWEAVAREHGRCRSIIVEELLDAGVVIQSHGDAIQHLKLLHPVVRPISLQQIQMEHRLREGQNRS